MRKNAFTDNRGRGAALSVGIGSHLLINPLIQTSPANPQLLAIGTPVITSQSANVLTIQWPITTSTRVAVTIYHSVDGYAAPIQAVQNITTGIGLSAPVNVSFAGLNAMDGITPVTYRITAEAT